MWSGIAMLAIAFLVLAVAIIMKLVATVSDSRPIFQLSVIGFIILYILAAVAISWLHPLLPRANISSLESLFGGGRSSAEAVPAPQSSQEVIIRE